MDATQEERGEQLHSGGHATPRAHGAARVDVAAALGGARRPTHPRTVRQSEARPLGNNKVTAHACGLSVFHKAADDR